MLVASSVLSRRRDTLSPFTCVTDYEILFKAQDEFIAANANTATKSKEDVYYDASTSGVTYYDDTGTVIHDYVPLTYFERMVAKLSSAPNRVRNYFRI